MCCRDKTYTQLQRLRKNNWKKNPWIILYWLYTVIMVSWIDGVEESILSKFLKTKGFWTMKSGKENDKWWLSNWKWGSHGNRIRGELRFLLNVQLKWNNGKNCGFRPEHVNVLNLTNNSIWESKDWRQKRREYGSASFLTAGSQ